MCLYVVCILCRHACVYSCLLTHQITLTHSLFTLHTLFTRSLIHFTLTHTLHSHTHTSLAHSFTSLTLAYSLPTLIHLLTHSLITHLFTSLTHSLIYSFTLHSLTPSLARSVCASVCVFVWPWGNSDRHRWGLYTADVVKQTHPASTCCLELVFGAAGLRSQHHKAFKAWSLGLWESPGRWCGGWYTFLFFPGFKMKGERKV